MTETRRKTPKAAHKAKTEKKNKAQKAKTQPTALARPRPAARPALAPDPARVERILELLAAAYPDARTALHWETPVQLLVATILSAQCTDERVNQVTPVLFAAYPTAAALAAAPRAAIEEIIRSTGFFHNKAKAIQGACKILAAQHGGEVPRDLEQLVQLPGVARKTANVVLGSAYGLPTGIAVDTHVARLAGRLGLSTESDPEKIERDLMRLIPQARWIAFSLQMILHGRAVCQARKPRCAECSLASWCPSAIVSGQ
jgi:endonuclease-3